MPPPQHADPELTLTAIAHILEIEADTVLHWTLAGRLHVQRQGGKTLIQVDAACTFANPHPDQILIIIKPSSAPKSQPPPSSSGPRSGQRDPYRGP